MASNTRDPEVVRISGKGQATIPKPLREKFGIETPGEVFVYEDDGRIVIEPVPSLEEMQGIHDHGGDPGDVMEKARAERERERRREAEREERLRPSDE